MLELMSKLLEDKRRDILSMTFIFIQKLRTVGGLLLWEALGCGLLGLCPTPCSQNMVREPLICDTMTPMVETNSIEIDMFSHRPDDIVEVQVAVEDLSVDGENSASPEPSTHLNAVVSTMKPALVGPANDGFGAPLPLANDSLGYMIESADQDMV